MVLCMNTLCYVRQGSRFVPVPDCTGYFYDGNGLFEGKTERSYAIVISQDVNIATLAYLDHSVDRMSWDDAKRFCFLKDTYMPSVVEMLQAAKFKEHLRFKSFDIEWTSTTFKDAFRNLCWGYYEYDIGCDSKRWCRYVRPFFELDVLTGKRIKCYV